jgi:hypothetical protein
LDNARVSLRKRFETTATSECHQVRQIALVFAHSFVQSRGQVKLSVTRHYRCIWLCNRQKDALTDVRTDNANSFDRTSRPKNQPAYSQPVSETLYWSTPFSDCSATAARSVTISRSGLSPYPPMHYSLATAVETDASALSRPTVPIFERFGADGANINT